MADKEKDIYGLLGYPLTHSFSMNFFNQKFESEHLNAEYLNFEIPEIDLLMEILSEFPTMKGLNVTIPYKEQIIPYMDEMDEAAREVGAVNVVKVIPATNGTHFMLKGYNSDIIGFSDSISPLLKSTDMNALILGTGGASKAITYTLKHLGLNVTLVSRTKKNDSCITYQDITEEIIKNNTVIVNTTPLGMYPNVDNAPDIPYEFLDSSHLCYDLLYNPDETKFMRLASQHGAKVKNGLEMLLLQAFASWNIWNS